MTRSPQFVRRVELVRSDEIERELTVMRQPVRRGDPTYDAQWRRGTPTTISPEVGPTPARTWMFAPSVTTNSVPSVGRRGVVPQLWPLRRHSLLWDSCGAV